MLEIKVRTNCNPGRLGAPLRYLIMCDSAAEKAVASCHAIDEPFVFRLQIRACVRILSNIEAHAAALQDHSMAVHVTSASPKEGARGIALSSS